MPSSLYFVAILPPPPVNELIQELKQFFAREYKAVHALNSPPHVTVIPPFNTPHESLTVIRKFLLENASILRPGKVILDGFGCFQPRVIYINTQISQHFKVARNEFLRRFYSLIPQHRQDTRPYHPHLTIAFKDLTPAMFNKAWPVMSRMGFSASFRIDKLVLLRYESGKWAVIEIFPLPDQQSM
jgi:2'-5' RNA ligase